MNLISLNNLFGLIAVEGAELGDSLVVDILNGMLHLVASLFLLLFVRSQTVDKMPWGYTVQTLMMI